MGVIWRTGAGNATVTVAKTRTGYVVTVNRSAVRYAFRWQTVAFRVADALAKEIRRDQTVFTGDQA